MLADLDSWDIGIDRLELAADLYWSFGLGVEGLEMGRSTVHPNQDAASRFSSCGQACRASLSQFE
jgi:hypothetical protein